MLQIMLQAGTQAETLKFADFEIDIRQVYGLGLLAGLARKRQPRSQPRPTTYGQPN